MAVWNIMQKNGKKIKFKEIIENPNFLKFQIIDTHTLLLTW